MTTLNAVREVGRLVHCERECKMVQLLWETIWQFLNKLNVQLPYGPAIALWHLFQRNQNLFSHTHTHKSVHKSLYHFFILFILFWSYPELETSQMSFNRRMSGSTSHAMNYCLTINRSRLLTYDNVHESSENYAAWKKSVPNSSITCHLYYIPKMTQL